MKAIIKPEYPMDAWEIEFFNDRRKAPRHAAESTGLFENYISGSFNVGRLVDRSQNGICLKTATPIAVGSEIRIEIDESSRHSEIPAKFSARIVWVKKHTDEHVYIAGAKLARDSM